jgi:hypothetical protein
MWPVERIAFRSRGLDFSSSGGGRHSTTSIVADGTEIVNAIDLLELDTDDPVAEPVQVIVCESCGTSGCNSGDRVSFRRLDDGLLMIPAFNAMAAGPWELVEYGSPHFMRKRGVPLLRGQALQDLRGRLPELARLDRWPSLTIREAALLVQWEAPSRVLGQFPDAPTLREDMIAAVSHGAGHEACTALNELLRSAASDERPAVPIPGEPVTFYLEQGGHPEWQCLTVEGETYRLALAPGSGVTFAQDSA